MGLKIEYLDGQNPLEKDEKVGLLIPSITTRYELDEFEQLNIQKALKWSITQTIKRDNILTENFIKTLHMKMFDEVWAWAGIFRKSNKNIGVDWPVIGIELKSLLDDVKFWIGNNTYKEDELVIRFKHRLVKIHCFPNGNGRHSMLMADILISHVFNKPIFSWGSERDLLNKGDTRNLYINALRAADKGDIHTLFEFARS